MGTGPPGPPGADPFKECGDSTAGCPWQAPLGPRTHLRPNRLPRMSIGLAALTTPLISEPS